MLKKTTLFLLMAGLAVTTAAAQHKAGRTGAAFLEIGVGAREAALGSAASTGAGDANQIFWNPAGTAMNGDQRLSAAFSYGSWIADLTHSGAAVGYSLQNLGTVSVGVQLLSLSDIPANRQNGYTDPILQDLVTDDETSATYNYLDMAVSASFARYVVEQLSLGATVKFVSQSIDGVSDGAVAFDFGSVYHVGVAGWQIAARLNNLGSEIEFYNQDNPLPLTFAIGTSIYPVNTESMRLMVSVDATKPLDSQQLIFGGAELSFYDLLFLRGGYKFNYSGTEDSGTTVRPSISTTIEKLSLGGGLQYVVSGYEVGVDYAFTQMELLDNVHRFTLRIGL